MTTVSPITRVSIVICTRNRAASLKQTLNSIGQCVIPPGMSAELLVVDNGSTDDTKKVVADTTLPNMPVRYLLEPIPGQAQTRNRALLETDCDIFLCTDDDIRAYPQWVDAMCRPIAEGRADATVGSRFIADHLRRPWLQPAHLEILACSEGRPGADLVGANMAFARHVLTRVPGFDTEIGLPRTAGGEDTLFSRQLCRADFKILPVVDGAVSHHFHPDRLQRSKMREAALKSAINDFYIEHHWMHVDPPRPWYVLIRSILRLWYYRIRRLHEWWTHESMPAWEKGMIQEVRKNWLHLRLHAEPRRYEKFGLTKLVNEKESAVLRPPARRREKDHQKEVV
jgi:glycosyltransferase involved in cell wall biosynthesis